MDGQVLVKCIVTDPCVKVNPCALLEGAQGLLRGIAAQPRFSQQGDDGWRMLCHGPQSPLGTARGRTAIADVDSLDICLQSILQSKHAVIPC